MDVEGFVTGLPWRQVRATGGVQPHEYVIVGTPGVEPELFWQAVDEIREHGYRGRYTPSYSGREQVNRYLEVGEHVVWHIWPNQLCRTLIADRQHTPIPEQPTLWQEER